MRMSARRQMPGRSLEREWAMVTVALEFFETNKQRHRLADDHAAADDDGFRAVGVDAGNFQQLHAAGRGAGDEAGRVFEHELGDVFRVEAIDVLARVDLADDGFLVDVLGRRRLDEDAVDGGVGVEIADDLEQFLLGGFRGQFDFQRVESELGAGAGFRADIDLRRGIAADQHHGEAGPDALG